MGLSFARHLAAMGALTLLWACAVPQDLGEERQIIAGADAPDAGFALQPVTRATLPGLAAWPQGHARATAGWLPRATAGTDPLIAPGDRLDIAVWDNSEATLLSAPGQKVVPLDGLTVSSSGTVFVPYAGEIYVAEQTPDEARQAIQAKLAPIAPSVQVQLAFASGSQNSAELLSGVARPGVYPLENRATSVTTLLALGGGIAETLVNPQVVLTRGGKVYRISAATLLADPALDTVLRGGDKLRVQADERYFLALGAAGREAIVPFPQDRISALDAMALMGGVNQATADPKGILILRDYPQAALRSNGSGPSQERMVFVLDLTTADGLFSAGEFAIEDRDLVLVTQSELVNTRTVMGLIGAMLGLSNAATNATQN